MSRITTDYNKDNFKRDVGVVCKQVAKQVTPRIMHAADKYIVKVKLGQLVWLSDLLKVALQ